MVAGSSKKSKKHKTCGHNSPWQLTTVLGLRRIVSQSLALLLGSGFAFSGPPRLYVAEDRPACRRASKVVLYWMEIATSLVTPITLPIHPGDRRRRHGKVK